MFLAGYLIYYGAATGPYLVDDYQNLVNNEKLAMTRLDLESIKNAAFSYSTGEYFRPISMLTFAADYYLGEDKSPYSIKLTNIILHLLTGLGVFLLSRLLLAGVFNTSSLINFASVSTTAVWLSHPLFVSTVLYSVQRMAILSALFVIYGCVVYIHFRKKLVARDTGFIPLIASVSLFTLLGFFSKENGALLPGFLLLIEVFLFRFACNRNTAGYKKALLGALLVLPVIAIIAWLVAQYAGNADNKAPLYAFTYRERLLTELRVMWHYLGWLLFLNPEPLGIYHDDIILSQSLISPYTTLLSAFGWLALLSVSFMLNKHTRIFSFCLLWFLWGHCLESTSIPLNLMFEHRNYLPGFGVILALCTLLAFFVRSGESIHPGKALATGLVVFILPNALLYERVQHWKDDKTLILSLLRNHPASTGTLIMATDYLNRSGDLEHALEAVHSAQALAPEKTSLLFAELVILCENVPQDRFSSRLSRKIRSIPVLDISSSSLVFYDRLVDTCFKSSVNHDDLIYLYEKFSGSNNNLMVSLSYYGLGNIYVTRQEYDKAARNWEMAVATSDNAGPLIPRIKQLKSLARRKNNSTSSPP